VWAVGIVEMCVLPGYFREMETLYFIIEETSLIQLLSRITAHKLLTMWI